MRSFLKPLGITLAFALFLGHGLAVIGWVRGLPPAPYGDEIRQARAVAQGALAEVWMPWRAAQEDAAPPAGLARGTLPLLAFLAAAVVVARRFRNPWRLLRIRRSGQHTVIAGVSPLGSGMLRLWGKAGHPVVVVSDDTAATQTVLTEGAAFLYGDAADESMLARARLATASTVWCIGQGDPANLRAATAAMRLLGAQRAPGAPPAGLLVEVDDPFLRSQVDLTMDRLAAIDQVHVRVFSPAQIAARALLRDYPIDALATTPAGRREVWIAGFGALGEELSLQILRAEYHREKAQRTRITVIDREADRRSTAFATRWPGYAGLAEMRFVEAHAEESGGWVAKRRTQAEFPAAIFICFSVHEHALATALAVFEQFRGAGEKLPIIWYRAPAIDSVVGTIPWIRAFGSEDWTAREALVSESLDGVARTIHAAYMADALARGESLGARRSLAPWSLLPEDLKDDNRMVADHHFVKLRAAGCVALRQDEAAGEFQWSDEEVERLARFEHDRWMGERLLRGWRHGERRDDAARVHPDLVPYERLSEGVRQLDRNVVIGLPAVMAKAGYAIRRQVHVALHGPTVSLEASEVLNQSLRAVFAELRAGAREPLLWLDADSPLACAAAVLAADEFGMRHAIVAAETATTTSIEPATATRARLFREAHGFAVRSRWEQVRRDLAANAWVSVYLSVDGRDLVPVRDAWGIDATGRVLFRPAELP